MYKQHKHTSILKTTCLSLLLAGFVFAFVGGFVPKASAATIAPCVPPVTKDQKETAPAAVNPECAKPGQVTLTKKNAETAGLQPKDINKAVAQTLGGVYTIVAIIAVLMIVIAGIRIITADGDATKVAGARQAIIYAMVGLGVVGSAFIITGIVQGIGTK